MHCGDVVAFLKQSQRGTQIVPGLQKKMTAAQHLKTVCKREEPTALQPTRKHVHSAAFMPPLTWQNNTFLLVLRIGKSGRTLRRSAPISASSSTGSPGCRCSCSAVAVRALRCCCCGGCCCCCCDCCCGCCSCCGCSCEPRSLLLPVLQPAISHGRASMSPSSLVHTMWSPDRWLPKGTGSGSSVAGAGSAAGPAASCAALAVSTESRAAHPSGAKLATSCAPTGNPCPVLAATPVVAVRALVGVPSPAKDDSAGCSHDGSSIGL